MKIDQMMKLENLLIKLTMIKVIEKQTLWVSLTKNMKMVFIKGNITQTISMHPILTRGTVYLQHGINMVLLTNQNISRKEILSHLWSQLKVKPVSIWCF